MRRGKAKAKWEHKNLLPSSTILMNSM
jgi:hypothetical protein